MLEPRCAPADQYTEMYFNVPPAAGRFNAGRQSSARCRQHGDDAHSPPRLPNDMAIDVAGIVRREKGDGSSGIFRRAWARSKPVQLNMFELLGGQPRDRKSVVKG